MENLETLVGYNMKEDNKCIITDIDGTLADATHRLGFIHTRPKNWKAFFAASKDDPPYHEVTWLVKTLKDAGCIILIVTARPESERERTITWLNENAGLKGVWAHIYMRQDDDPRDDAIVKSEILEDIYRDGYNPFIVLDDRDNVVKMWRESGLRCLQVNPGNF